MGLVVQAPIRGWRSIGQLGLPKRRMIKIVARDGGQDRSDTRQRRARPSMSSAPKTSKAAAPSHWGLGRPARRRRRRAPEFNMVYRVDSCIRAAGSPRTALLSAPAVGIAA